MPSRRPQKGPAETTKKKAAGLLEAPPKPKGKGKLKRTPKLLVDGDLDGDKQLWEVEKAVDFHQHHDKRQ